MVKKFLIALAIVAMQIAPALAADENTERVRLLRAQGTLALTILAIVLLGSIGLIRIYTRSVRRRWRTPATASRMHPWQWQARRWREQWRKPSTPSSSNDSEN